MSMTVTYAFEGNLYVNPTNRCNYNCNFCLRRNQSSRGSIYHDDLWLDRQPTKEEMLDSILAWDLSQFAQIVFCGFGEPSYRMEDICWVIDELKERGVQNPIRMNTNGTGSVIHGRDITPEFAGRFDEVSVSLNTDTAEKYDALCHPDFPGAFEAMKDFTRRLLRYVPRVVMTVVDTISPEEIEACRRICEEEVGAQYRVRAYIPD